MICGLILIQAHGRGRPRERELIKMEYSSIKKKIIFGCQNQYLQNI